MYMAVAAGGLEVKEISLTAASEAERQAELRKEARQARLVEEKSDTRQLLRQMYGPGIYVLTGEVENAFENGGVVGVKKVGRTGVETFDLQIEKGAMTGETLAEWTHEQGWGAGLGWAIGNVVTYSGLALAPMAEVINRLAESEKAVRVINTALALWLAVSGGMPHRAGTGLGKQINRPDQSDITPGKDGPPGWYVTWAAIIAGFLAACRAALAGTPQIPDAGVPTDRPGPGVTVVPRETPTLPPTAGENGVVPATTQPPETCKIDGLQLGSKYPAEVSGLVKPIGEWTDSEKQNIVDADGNPIFAGVTAIADSAWATGHGFQVAGTWIGKGCGYGLLFKDVNGNLVWAADGQGQALGRPDGNGIGVGFVTMPGFGGPGEPGLIVGKEQELVWIADGVVVGKADPVRHVWNKLEAAATPEPTAVVSEWWTGELSDMARLLSKGGRFREKEYKEYGEFNGSPVYPLTVVSVTEDAKKGTREVVWGFRIDDKSLMMKVWYADCKVKSAVGDATANFTRWTKYSLKPGDLGNPQLTGLFVKWDVVVVEWGRDPEECQRRFEGLEVRPGLLDELRAFFTDGVVPADWPIQVINGQPVYDLGRWMVVGTD